MELLKTAEDFIALFLPFGFMMAGGIYMTLKGRFFQIKGLIKSCFIFKDAFKSKGKEGNGRFAAACNSLAATVGTGNIAGVASAVSIGGAGSVFWMWVTAFTGMAIKFAEIKLAVIFREKSGGNFYGGPMYYIKKGLPQKLKGLSVMFCLAAVPAVLCSGNVTQVNAAVSCLDLNFKSKLILGIGTAAAVFYIINRSDAFIGKVTEKLVPIMAIVYILMSFGVIFLNFNFLPQAFMMIFKGAFNPMAVTGGMVGSFLTAAFSGASRGIFSNEAGLGTAAMAHAAAVDADEKTQGYFGIFEVFVDTILLCTLTALTILCSGVKINYGSTASSELVAEALAAAYGGPAQELLFVMMAVFAFSSVIGWAIYGNCCSHFLLGRFGKRLFNLLYPFACIAGAVFNVEIAWRLAAFFNGIMLCINLPSVVYLGGKALEGEKIDRKNSKITGKFKTKTGGAYNRP